MGVSTSNDNTSALFTDLILFCSPPCLSYQCLVLSSPHSPLPRLFLFLLPPSLLAFSSTFPPPASLHPPLFPSLPFNSSFPFDELLFFEVAEYLRAERQHQRPGEGNGKDKTTFSTSYWSLAVFLAVYNVFSSLCNFWRVLSLSCFLFPDFSGLSCYLRWSFRWFVWLKYIHWVACAGAAT